MNAVKLSKTYSREYLLKNVFMQTVMRLLCLKYTQDKI